MSKTAQLPSEEEQAYAAKAVSAFDSLPAHESKTVLIQIVDEKGKPQHLAIPAIALRLMKEALSEVAKGNGVKLMPVKAELTTQEAAEMLGISRPSFVRLIEGGAIPFTKIGRHRRVRLEHLVAYKARRDAECPWVLAELESKGQMYGVEYGA